MRLLRRILWTTTGIAALSFAAGFGLGRVTGHAAANAPAANVVDGPIATSAVPFTVAPSGSADSPSSVATTSLAMIGDASVMLPPLPAASGSAPRPMLPPASSERALVESARTSLSRGRPSDALLMTEQAGNLFPNGELAEDRDFLRVSALRDLGRIDEALARARAFVTFYPRSPYRRTVQAFVDSAPPPPVAPAAPIIVVAPKPSDAPAQPPDPPVDPNYDPNAHGAY